MITEINGSTGSNDAGMSSRGEDVRVPPSEPEARYLSFVEQPCFLWSFFSSAFFCLWVACLCDFFHFL